MLDCAKEYERNKHNYVSKYYYGYVAEMYCFIVESGQVSSCYFSGLKGIGLLKGFATLSFLGFFTSLWLFLLSPFPIIVSPLTG